MSTQTIYSEGLADEHDLVVSLYADNKDALKDRVSDDKITAYTAQKEDMETNRAAADQAEEAKENLTKQEDAAAADVAKRIHNVKEDVKKEFGRGSPEAKVFHSGEAHNNSSAVLAGWSSDYVKAFPKYQARLANQGLLPADITALGAAGVSLAALNKQQTESETTAKNATQAYNDSIDLIVKTADSIHNAAAIAFASQPDILAKFTAARKLRFVAPPRKQKTPTPANTTSTDKTTTKA